MDALVDLTGGLAERYEMSTQTPAVLYQKLARAAVSGTSFITCSRKVNRSFNYQKLEYYVQGDWKAQDRSIDEVGLIAGHAYTVTDVKTVLNDVK